jgi:hypothetical protein
MRKTFPLEEFNNLYVVEYSIEQNTTNVITVTEMLNKNRENLARQNSMDYVPIAFTVTRDEAVALAQALQDNINKMNAQHIQLDEERYWLYSKSEDTLWRFLSTRKPDDEEN